MNADSIAAPARESAITAQHDPMGVQTSARNVILLCYFGYLLSFADRVIFGLVLKPIKSSLHFTDSQLGILSGVAFAISYAVFSPISGYIVDRWNRKVVLLAAIAFWSGMTFMTGLATTFISLGFAGAFVGVGEAFMHPLAVSLIGDAVPRERRARVFSFYISAGALGGIFAYLFGGAIVHLLTNVQMVHMPVFGLLAPWRVVFLCAAVPGLILIALIATLLREPPRTARAVIAQNAAGGALAFARRYWKLLVAMFIGLATLQLGAYTWSTWAILFFGRIHDWTITEAALRMGIPAAAMALAGCLASGRVIEALRQRGYIDAPLRIGIAGGFLFAALACAGVLAHTALVSAGLLVVASLFSYVPTIGAYAAMGDVLPAASRGRFAGLSILAIGLMTNSIGPLVVGTLSDHVFHAAFGLRYALASTFLGSAVLGSLIVLPGLPSYRSRMQEDASVSLATVPSM